MTKILIDFADETLVTVAKTEALAVNVDKFNDAVLRYVFTYGLKQILNDAGSAGKSPEEKVAMAEKKLAAMYEGTVRMARGAGETPIEAEVYKLARAEVVAAIKATGRKVKDIDADALDAAIERFTEKNAASLTARAEKILAERAKAAPTVDLADLGL